MSRKATKSHSNESDTTVTLELPDGSYRTISYNENTVKTIINDLYYNAYKKQSQKNGA